MALQIITGDCLNSLSSLPGDSIDFVLFSPPYDNIRTYNGFPAIDRVALGKALNRVAKEGCIAAVVIQDKTTDGAKSLSSFRWAVDWVDNCGWRLFETCIYERHGVPGRYWNNRFRVDHEYIHLFVKGDKPAFFDKEPLKVAAKHAGKRMSVGRRLKSGVTEKQRSFVCAEKKCRGTVWHYSTSSTEGNRLKVAHPATFPDALARDLITCFCPVGGMVLDPMCGSGTTLVSAGQLNRNAIGMEISPEYAEIARQRLSIEVPCL